MGRVKASKLTGKFYLRIDRKPDKSGKLPIYLDYTIVLCVSRWMGRRNYM